MSNRSINLDFSKSPVAPVIIYGRVGDNGLQTITVHLSNFNEPIDLRDGVLAFEGLISDGQTKIIDSEGITADPEKLLEGTFEYTFPSAAFSMEGIYKRAYFSFQKEGKRNTTGDFKVIVLGNTDIDVEEAESIITEYNKLIDQLHELYTQTAERVTEEYEQFHQQVTERMTEINELINNTKIDLQGLQDKVAELKHIVENLENLSVVYSDSINFGDYDYSGNPNLFRNIDSNNWIVGTGVTKGSEENVTTFTLSDSTTNPNAYVQTEVPILSPNKKYTMSTKVFLDNPASSNNYLLYCLNKQSDSLSYLHIKLSDLPLNEWVEVETMANQHEVSFDPSEITSAWLQLLLNGFTGTIKIKNELKIEEGESATPYQPNLLIAPFYLSKQVTGERMYKYFGTGIKDSDNPNDFVWDLTSEYIEANFAKETEVETNTNNIAMLIDDLRVVTANVVWMKNNTYVLGEWQDLSLTEGYQGGDGTSPKYRVDTIDGHKKLSFRGAVTTTSNTLPSQTQQHIISTLPDELTPSDTKMGLGTTNSLSTSCRIAVTSAGNLYVGNDSGKDVKYCYLDTFSYWLD